MFGETDVHLTVIVEVPRSLLNLPNGRAPLSNGYFEHIHHRPNRASYPR